VTFMKVVLLMDVMYFTVVFASAYDDASFNLISLGCHCMSVSNLFSCF